MKKPVWLKPLLFVVLLAPMTVLAISWVRLLSGTDVPALTADPVAETTRVLGEWSLRSLLAALAVTPVARLPGWTPILTARRRVGLISSEQRRVGKEWVTRGKSRWAPMKK